jgi:hypothetical protein
MANKVVRDIPMPEFNRIGELHKEPETAILHLITYRPYEGGVYSAVHVHYVTPSGAITMTLFQDYSRKLEYNKDLRATQKNIDNQHARLFTPEVIEALKADARAHYAHKRAAA